MFCGLCVSDFDNYTFCALCTVGSVYPILIIGQIPQIIHSLTHIVWRPQVQVSIFHPPFHYPISPLNDSNPFIHMYTHLYTCHTQTTLVTRRNEYFPATTKWPEGLSGFGPELPTGVNMTRVKYFCWRHETFRCGMKSMRAKLH